MQVIAPFFDQNSTCSCGNISKNNPDNIAKNDGNYNCSNRGGGGVAGSSNIAINGNNRINSETDNIFYHFVGNFIPPEWKDLTGTNGKKLTKTARQLLSFIVFRLRLSKSEPGKSETGKNEVGNSSADNQLTNNQSTNNQLNRELQESYYYFEQVLGVGQRRVRQCLLELEQGGFIVKELRTLYFKSIKCRNMLAIRLLKNFIHKTIHKNTHRSKKPDKTNRENSKSAPDCRITAINPNDLCPASAVNKTAIPADIPGDISSDLSTNIKKNYPQTEKNFRRSGKKLPPYIDNKKINNNKSRYSKFVDKSENYQQKIKELEQKAIKMESVINRRELTKLNPEDKIRELEKIIQVKESELQAKAELLEAEMGIDSEINLSEEEAELQTEQEQRQYQAAKYQNSKWWKFTKKPDYFYPLLAEDAAYLQNASGRDFNLEYVNKLLLKLAELKPQLRFLNKKAMLAYLTKALTHELRKEQIANSQNFTFNFDPRNEAVKMPKTVNKNNPQNNPRSSFKTRSNGSKVDSGKSSQSSPYYPLSELKPDSIWYKIRTGLIEYYGDNIDLFWFSKLKAIKEDHENKTITLQASSLFVRDWVRDNYLNNFHYFTEGYSVELLY